ncbi:MAG: RNA methyltransferase [Flavobacteriales bacterium]|nr:RNA methyltransferase [Flavobacteriales bacterium]MCB9364802.1 RNA methyltransferase [Flavobacteriales bacterium]
MLSANQKKYLNSLKQKKYRYQHSTFIVEGEKMVNELVASDFEIEVIYGVEDLLSYPSIVKITEKELASVSLLKTPNKYFAVAKQKKSAKANLEGLTLVLDNIQDPGNLGTIIRIADWFGVSTIICSPTCVDVYNPKVVQATMGSLFRVNIVYTDLISFLEENKDNAIYGALLGGENVYETTIQKENSILVMGNESKGISKTLKPYINHKIAIPQFGKAESLNVAVATAILCSEYRRGI